MDTDIKKLLGVLRSLKECGISNDVIKKSEKDLKELEEYRQIGTLDDCRVTRDELIELQEYRRLGTVKECWEAREKQIPKKVKFKTITIESYPSCPHCNEFYCDCSGGENYCKNCGQKWEWGD